MPDRPNRSHRFLITTVIYIVAIAGAVTVASLRARAKTGAPAYNAEDVVERPTSGKPFFSLSTHRTYGTNDNARLWVDYQAVDHLDFRVYQVKDPRKFFTELKDPHQVAVTRS